ncbi:hypothetical protein T484DRAFT_1799573 [Baffinella frigidus]|nr:hypothetical protein T484DRAFT_1799573 [Cryptophyta sp. CCMP2293]
MVLKEAPLVETPEVLQHKLTELWSDLVASPAHQLSGEDPASTSPEFLALFLRTEDLNVRNAATRYRRYWEMRVTLFGDDAGKPFSAERERATLDLGFPILVQGGRDKLGRQLIVTDQGNMNSKIAGPVQLCRAVWYVVHAALEDPEVNFPPP